MSGEFAFIDWIRTRQQAGGIVRLSAGDDLAVLDWPAGELLLVGVDQVMDGVHFDSAVHSPGDIGRKVMNRNLSDCAAMACLPAAAVATVALPRSVSMDYAKELYLGMQEAAGKYRCVLVGGDTGSWNGKLVMTVSILGRTAGIRPVLRSGAKAGDTIYVTGPLGGSILGRHLRFEPRIDLARELAGRGVVHAMIDISDGLSRDLRHICRESGLGAVIDAERIPVHDDAVELSKRTGRPAVEHALHDGEDHELIVVGASGLAAPLVEIGRMVAGEGITIRTSGRQERLEAKAWEHRFETP
ncbi:MAG: thiamine-phosphate kinase [Tepidisphaeraceae bacterium]|jgi:thiamine-monophosphate kinase